MFTPLNGGPSWRHTDAYYEKFNTMYATDLEVNNRMYLSENASSDKFRFFIDVDVHTRVPPPVMLWLAVKAQMSVRAFCAEATDESVLEAMVSLAPPKFVVKRGQIDHVSSGMHVVFPNLVVHRSMALQLAEYLRSELQVHPALRSAVDTGVYGSSSVKLRMNGSYTCGESSGHDGLTECLFCKAKKRQGQSTRGVGVSPCRRPRCPRTRRFPADTTATLGLRARSPMDQNHASALLFRGHRRLASIDGCSRVCTRVGVQGQRELRIDADDR